MENRDFRNIMEAAMLLFFIAYLVEWVDMLYMNFGLLSDLAKYVPEWLDPTFGRGCFFLSIFFYSLYGKSREAKILRVGDRTIYTLLILLTLSLGFGINYFAYQQPDKQLYLNIAAILCCVVSFSRVRDCFDFLVFGSGEIKTPELDKRYPLAKEPFVSDDEANDTSFSFKTNMGWLNIERSNQGVAVIGGAGAGKSYSFLDQMLRELTDRGFTGWVYDFKFPVQTTILFRAWLHCERPDKPELYIVNFTDILRSNRANPLRIDNLENRTYIQEFAAAFLKNLNPEWIRKQDFWYQESYNMVVGAIEFLKNNEPNYCTVPHLTSLLLSNVEEVVQLLCNDFDSAENVQSIKTAFDKGAEGQISGVVASVQGPFKKINTPEIFWVLSGDDFDFNLNDKPYTDINNPENNRRPKLLVVGAAAELNEALSPITSLFATICMKKLNRPNKLKSVFLNDEIPTLFIPKLDELPATGRSNNVCTILGMQDFSQLNKKWGKELTDALISNMGTQLCGMVNHMTTAENYSKMFGQDDIQKKSTTYSENDSYSVSTQRQNIVEPSTVTKQKRGHFLGKLSTGDLFSCQIIAEGCKTDEEIPIISPILTPENKDAIIEENFRKIKSDVQELFYKYRNLAKANLMQLIEDARTGNPEAINEAFERKKIIYRQKKDEKGNIDFIHSILKLSQGYTFSLTEVGIDALEKMF